MNYHYYRGHRIAYRAEGDGPPMLFLHNGGNDHRIWDHQMHFFAPICRVYAMDLLGNGESDRPVIEYTLDLFVDILHDFITALGLERVILVGNCIGSAMSLRYAALYPDTVSRLILFNIATERTVSAGFFGIFYRLSSVTLLRRMLGHLAAMDFLSRLMGPLKYHLQFGGLPVSDREFRQHLYSVYSSAGHLRMLYNLLLNMPSFARLDSFVKPRSFPPLHVFWGGNNRVLPARAGRALCESLAPDTAAFYKGAGHLLMRERSDAVNRAMAGMAGFAPAESLRIEEEHRGVV